MAEQDAAGEALKSRVQRRIDDLQPRLVDVARRLHAKPEPGHREYHSVELITQVLEDVDCGCEISLDRGLGGLDTAFRARIKGRGRGPKIAFLAEYDALPELGHACGHNLIAATSLGAFLTLTSVITKLDGEVFLFGTPAEEGVVPGAGGKAILAEAGFFDGLDAAMMIHPASQTTLFNQMSAREALQITFKGEAAHAAAPGDPGINALSAAIDTFNRWRELETRLPDGVKIHGIISEGGTAANIVPERAQIQFYVRAPTTGRLEELLEPVLDCAREACRQTGAGIEVERMAERYDNLVTNEVLAHALKANLESLGEAVPAKQVKGAGSTDMGNVSLRVPSVHAYVGIEGVRSSLHSQGFARAADRKAAWKMMNRAAKSLAMTAVDLLTEPALVTRMKEEFECLEQVEPA